MTVTEKGWAVLEAGGGSPFVDIQTARLYRSGAVDAWVALNKSTVYEFFRREKANELRLVSVTITVDPGEWG